ncbi:polysaccharide deacetylase family protein [Clostridium sp. YIM B02515]|uniref:Polysaccharide deacetylase family protein n=2 Tax=Clostridium rhizosphaerae TaxID=2803861 RepID=A0ABS1TA90_9CLOT|nr:polysaccharide deacetylase family protein [Clostridium rhizosphaerae]
MAVKGIGKSKNIPILMYHSIDYEKGNELRIPKDKFREQMKYLKDNGYTPLSLDELYSHMVNGTSVPEKPIVITLDDGYSDNYTNAYPVLREFGFKATVFVITNTVEGGGSYLNAEQIKEMDKNGIDMESHTVSHPRLNELSYDKQMSEMKESKEYLEKLLNKDINYIAYPYGNFNENTLKAVEEIGYKMAVSTKSGLAAKSDGIYKLHRIYISNNYDMEKFKRLVNGK